MSVLSSVSLGTAAQGIGLLQAAGMTSQEWQIGTINNPLIRSRVVAAIRNQPGPHTISIEQVYERETYLTAQYCGLAGVEYPGNVIIEQACKKAASVWGELTEHDRFIPGNIGLGDGTRFFHRFNASREEARSQTLKLYSSFTEAEWGTSRNVQHIPTVAGMIRLDFSRVLQPTDLLGRPFYLTNEEHIEWAKEQDGDGLTSGEEGLVLFGRSVIERNLPLWGAGSARMRNVYGSKNSLCVYWNARNGLGLVNVEQDLRYWDLATLPRKFVALGA